MFNKYLVALLILLTVLIFTAFSGVYGNVCDDKVSIEKALILLTAFSGAYDNVCDDKVPIENITKISYNHVLFLEYDANSDPVFYIDELKDYYIKPIKVCTIGVNESLLKTMNFKVNYSNYDVLISNKSINTNKDAIFFTPIYGSTEINATNSLIYWNEDPLNYKTSEVVARYKLPNKGKVIATYEDGSPACIMINNKIYCGFDPNREVLYNLLYIFMINKVPYTMLFAMLVVLIISSLSASSQKFREFLIKLGTFIVFGRISYTDEEKVLLNDTRREIYNCIIDNPGIHLREMSKKLGKGVSTITWHLRILEKADLIRSRKLGNRIIYYPKGMDISDLPLLYLDNKTSQEVFNYILHKPAHLRKIAEDLGMPVETVRYNLKKMEEMNLITSKEDGNKIVYYVNYEYIKSLNIG